MNILWIEDNENIEELKQELFEGKDEFEFNLIYPKSFDDGFEMIERCIQNIDFAIFDIDLNKFDIGVNGKILMEEFELKEEDFKIEAGFHLYLKMIQNGIRNDRIIFLTGNTSPKNNLCKYIEDLKYAKESNDIDLFKTSVEKINLMLSQEDASRFEHTLQSGNFKEVEFFLEKYKNNETKNNTYDKYNEYFKQARISIAKSIHKDDSGEIKQWLEKNIIEKNNVTNYINLRRGIIEGCKYLKNEIAKKNDEELIDFLVFYKTVKDCNTPEINIIRKNTIEYLDKIERILPFYLHNSNSEYKIFLKELSAEWELSEGFLIDKVGIESDFKNFRDGISKIMKILRNWTAHNLLSDNLDERKISFLFIVAVHSFFKLDLTQIRDYEINLLKCFEKKDLVDFEGTITNQMAKSYFSIRNKFGTNNPNRNEFCELVKNYGYQEIDLEDLKKNSFKLIYQCLWHSIIPSRFVLHNPNSGGVVYDSISMKIFFNYDRKDIVGICKHIAEAIYSESF